MKSFSQFVRQQDTNTGVKVSALRPAGAGDPPGNWTDRCFRWAESQNDTPSNTIRENRWWAAFHSGLRSAAKRADQAAADSVQPTNFDGQSPNDVLQNGGKQTTDGQWDYIFDRNGNLQFRRIYGHEIWQRVNQA